MGIGKNQAEKRIRELRETISEHNRRYYVLNSPTISDFEYDLLMQELQSLEKLFPEFMSEDSPSVKVGSDLDDTVSKEFAQFPHRFPMLSLANTYSISELADFETRCASALDSFPEFSCELKFDGTAICLTYSRGLLVRALTRGDGTKGDDVTANVKTISSIPTYIGDIHFDFEIRGEIYMPYSSFDRLNAERREQEETPFANPRNAASGSLKLQNPAEVKERGLECVLYHILGENLPFKKHTEAIKWAAEHGFPVSAYSQICSSVEEVTDYISHWDSERKFLPFATDGIVVKVNDLASQKRLGYTAKVPRWATAYKFKPEEALTRVISFDYQVGRTGVVTPVANLEPVPLSGTIVKRATLHNADQMTLLDIRTDDYVYVEKGGEIIPKITRVELSKRKQDSVKPSFPVCCPVCGTPLKRDEEESKHYCPNADGCPPQIKGRFVHFASRKAMDILLGDATAEQFYSNGLISELPDLYKITKEQLLRLEGWKERASERFLESVEKSKQVPFQRVLFALGIPQVGETTAKLLAEHYRDIKSISTATASELTEIDEIGDTLANTVSSWFSDERHRKLLEELERYGLRFALSDDEGKVISNVLNGATVVVTGNFSIPREEMKKLIAAHGGKNTSSVSGNTSYLLAGEKCGPEKIKKAEKLGVAIISEEDFYKLINDNRII